MSWFDVTNNTSFDYLLPVDAWKQRLMESQAGSLLGATGWRVSLSQANMPFFLPADFFDPKPISVPGHATVEILLAYDSAYTLDAIKGKTKEQIIEGEFHQTDSLVMFDDVMHYRINLPMKDVWKVKKP